MLKRSLPAVVLGAALALGFAAPTIPGAQAQDIQVGEYASLTGSEATFGINSDNGVQLAAEEINNSGGVLGRKIKLVVEDDQSKPSQASSAVEKLIASDKAVAVIGEIATRARWRPRRFVRRPKSR